MLYLRDGQRDHPGVGRGWLAGPGGWWCLGVGAVLQEGGGDGADGQGGHHQHEVAGDRGVEADLGLAGAEAVLAEFEVFFHGPAQPGGADQPGHGQLLAFGDVAVVESQLTGLGVAADQQAVPGGGGCDLRPRIPAGTLGALPGGADLVAACVLQQPAGSLRACDGGPGGQGEVEVRGDPQHIALAAAFEELPQLGAVAVDLVPQTKSNAMPSVNASVQMSMASCPLVRNSRSRGSPMTRDFTGSSMCSAGIHCPGPGQRVPGVLPHIRQVHRVSGWYSIAPHPNAARR